MKHPLSVSSLFKKGAAAAAIAAATVCGAESLQAADTGGSGYAEAPERRHSSHVTRQDGTEIPLIELTPENYEEAFRQCDQSVAYIFFYRTNSAGYHDHIGDIEEYAGRYGHQARIMMFDMAQMDQWPAEYKDHPLKRLADREVEVIPTAAKITKWGKISIGTFEDKSPRDLFLYGFAQVDCLQPLDGRALRGPIDVPSVEIPLISQLIRLPEAALSSLPDFSELSFPLPFPAPHLRVP